MATATAAQPAAPSRGLPPAVRGIAIALLFLAGLLVRLQHLNDPLMDFHAARQYFSANRARVFFLAGRDGVSAQDRAVTQANANFTVEPPVIERLAVLGYRLVDDEILAIPRLISLVCWLIGGIFLLLLAARLFGGTGSVLVLGVYLLLPYGVAASRAFQPEPLMTALMLAGLYYLWRYHERPTPGLFIAAALCSAAAIYVKINTAPFLLAAAAALLWPRRGWRPLALYVVLALLPAAAYYVDGLFLAGFMRKVASSIFVPRLIVTGYYWEYWGRMIHSVVSLPLFLLALTGALFTRETTARRFIAALGVAYLLYGLVFTYAICSHNYYQVPVIPLFALALGRLGQLMDERLTSAGTVALGLAAIIGAWFALGAAQRRIVQPWMRTIPQMCEGIGVMVQHTTHAVALTQADGEVLNYYGKLHAAVWPLQIDVIAAGLRGQPVLSTTERLRILLDGGAEYFIVTDLKEFTTQRDLANLLTRGYPCVAHTAGLLIFDLRHPKEPQ
jgi:hypothetical protein